MLGSYGRVSCKIYRASFFRPIHSRAFGIGKSKTRLTGTCKVVCCLLSTRWRDDDRQSPFLNCCFFRSFIISRERQAYTIKHFAQGKVLSYGTFRAIAFELQRRSAYVAVCAQRPDSLDMLCGVPIEIHELTVSQTN